MLNDFAPRPTACNAGVVSRRFAGPLAKLRRADALIDELAKAVDDFDAERPYAAVPELEEDTGRFEFFLVDAPAAPIEWAVRSGEVVHHLRSALDHLVLELSVGTMDEEQIRQTGFPIARTHAAYERRSPSMIGQLTPEDRDSVAACQPYHESFPDTHPLAVLHRLWNIDKHRALHVVRRVLVHTSFSRADFPAGFVVEELSVSHSTGGGGTVAKGKLRRLDPTAMFDPEPWLFTEVQLEDALPHGGDAPQLVEALRELSAHVSQVVLPKFVRRGAGVSHGHAPHANAAFASELDSL